MRSYALDPLCFLSAQASMTLLVELLLDNTAGTQMLALTQAIGVIAAQTALEIDASEAGNAHVLQRVRGGFIDVGQNNQTPSDCRVSTRECAPLVLGRSCLWAAICNVCDSYRM